MISNVFPGSTSDKIADSRAANAVVYRDGLLLDAAAGPPPTDSADLIVRQLGRPLALAANLAALTDLVSDVVRVPAEPKVAESDARGRVAVVQHVVGGPGPGFEEPGHPTGFLWPPLPAADIDEAVALLVGAAGPEPASVRLADARPESAGEVDFLTRVRAGATTESTTAARDGRAPGDERSSAFLADSIDVGAAVGLESSRSRIVLHRNLIRFGATPPAVDAARGHFAALNSTGERHGR